MFSSGRGIVAGGVAIAALLGASAYANAEVSATAPGSPDPSVLTLSVAKPSPKTVVAGKNYIFRVKMAVSGNPATNVRLTYTTVYPKRVTIVEGTAVTSVSVGDLYPGRPLHSHLTVGTLKGRPMTITVKATLSADNATSVTVRRTFRAVQQ